MFERFSKIAVVAIAAALTTAALAVAQGGGSRDANDDKGQRPPSFEHGPGGPGGPGRAGGPGGHGGPLMFQKNMTYTEIHTQSNGTAHVIRLDAGKVKAVDSDSITITENDGNDVTVAVDSDTDVRLPGNPDAEVSDLKAGQQVMVDHKDDGAAEHIGVLPAKKK